MPSLEPMVTMASVSGSSETEYGLAQAGQAAGERVAMGRGLLRGLDELVDDVLGGGAVGVAHAEVDDVFAAFAGGGFQLAGDVEYIRGQPRQPSEFFHACLVGSFAFSKV